MKNIKLTKKQFEELEPLQVSTQVLNTEGALYNFSYKNQEKILKTLYTINDHILFNKLYTIETLDENAKYLPDSFCIPDYLVTIRGITQNYGFTVPKLNGKTLTEFLNDKTIKTEEQIYYLKKVGKILNQLSAIRKHTPLKNIYIGDVHESNFIIDPSNKKLSVIDLDSCKIGDNEPFPARYLTPRALLNNANKKYNINKDSKQAHVIADENSDLYCYNIMIMNYLYGGNINIDSLEEFYSYITYLDKIGINGNLLDCFERLVVNKPNKNPEIYLETLTNEEVYKAKKRVYNKIGKTNHR